MHAAGEVSMQASHVRRRAVACALLLSGGACFVPKGSALPHCDGGLEVGGGCVAPSPVCTRAPALSCSLPGRSCRAGTTPGSCQFNHCCLGICTSAVDCPSG